MNLYSSISQRKSCRKYVMEPVKQELIDDVENAVRGFDRLFPEVPLEYRMSQKVKGRFSVAAPHYLIVSGEGKPGELESTGFLFQQLVLWLDAMELGSVWLGASRDAEAADTGRDIITLAFGHVMEPVHRTREQFKRRPIDAITNAPDDVCIQAAHLAPSGMNTQPWYFEKQDGKVLVYQQRLKPPVSLLYKHSDVDMGIGLCHYALACREIGRPFNFYRDSTIPGKAGYYSFGVIE